ncbi:hypothetical protein QBE52_01425 [Clostridiaceae bacterium 35-E11]
MMPIIRQTITQKKLSFWKLLCMLFGAIFIMDLAIKVFSKINPVIGTIGGLIALVVATVGCAFIIYRHMAYFNYRVIDDELIMEKVFGKTNHLFLSLKLSELEKFKPYKEVNMEEKKSGKVKYYRFVSGKNTNAWYVGEFTRDGICYRFIIEPNEKVLNAITVFYLRQQ